MKPTTSPLLYLSLALGLLTGCGRDEAPAPAAEAAYSRTVTYLDSASPSQLDSIFRSPVIKTFVLQNATYFTVFLQRQPDREAIAFNFVRTKLPANPIGTYRFKTQQDNTPDVDVTYRIAMAVPIGSGRRIYDRYTSSPTGSFAITGYTSDAHGLISVSGRFEVNIPNASDPFAPYLTDIPRRCDLSFEGTFTNAPVQDVQ